MTDRFLDLDAARAARAEVGGDRPRVMLGGEEFLLPAELPMRYIWTLADGDDMAALKVLFNGQLERFLATEPTKEDIVALAGAVPRLYGMGQSGESSASAGSSKNGSNRSRPTSPASTASTSARRVTGRKRSG